MLLTDTTTGLVGQAFYSPNIGATTAQSAVWDFTINLPSALLGSLASKAVPLSLMGAGTLYLSIETVKANVAFVGSASITSINSYTLTDLYFNAKISELPSDIEESLIYSTKGSILLPATSYKGESKTLSVGSSIFNDKYSFQFSSIKNFLFFMQNNASSTSSTPHLKRSITSRPACNIASWQLALNGSVYPSQAIDTQSKMFMELRRSYDMLVDVNCSGIINRDNYLQGAGTTATDILNATVANTTQYRFVSGVDLDRFNHSSDTLLSGTSTIGQTLDLNINFGQTSITEQMNVYGFCQYDLVFEMENGLFKPRT
jgi:hypothetical protein